MFQKTMDFIHNFGEATSNIHFVHAFVRYNCEIFHFHNYSKSSEEQEELSELNKCHTKTERHVIYVVSSALKKLWSPV